MKKNYFNSTGMAKVPPWIIKLSTPVSPSPDGRGDYIVPMLRVVPKINTKVADFYVPNAATAAARSSHHYRCNATDPHV
jgi:hypothetical protein